MNRAIDVAKYMVNYANDNSYEISNLKLQKLLYYAQAAFLIESNGKEICFPQKIVAWLHGPVVENVYYEFSRYGGEQIPKQKFIRKIVRQNQRFEFNNIPFSVDILCENDRKIVDRVLKGLLIYDAWELVNRTHEEKPWLNAKEFNDEITAESIFSYFQVAENRGRVYGNFN